MHVADDVAGFQTIMVNVYFIGTAQRWILVDAGVPMQARRIIRAVELRFGRGARPIAIVLTHGHFDHVGSLRSLLEHWDVPLFAHRLELPYLTGQADYPPPDPTVGGGIFSRLSPLFPRHAYDFSRWIVPLPDDGSVPGLDESWRWIHTPGHSPGHVSLFRESDRVLVAGDAFVTQKQESFFAVMSNAQHVHGPPMYFTIDWQAAKHSVQALAKLEPSVAATGHGIPMRGWNLLSQLDALALHFEQLGMPSSGRYVHQPAVTDEHGVISVPPPMADPVPKVAAAAVLVGIGAYLAMKSSNRKQQTRRSIRHGHSYRNEI